MQDIYSRFAPFIKEYAFKSGWMGLRPVQESAARVIFETQNNLLLSCGTSSGKTEAAFFPVLSELYQKKRDGVSVLYIAPLKALINDQFERISYLCKMAGITVAHRHADVSSASKKDFSDSPTDILQITPESLEGLIMLYGVNTVKKLFSSLKYVIIDELHALLGTDRGLQVLCQIGRIMALTEVNPRIIGLSATIGDTSLVCNILSGVNGRKTVSPSLPDEGLQVSLLYEYLEDDKAMDAFVYDAVKKKNSLVFSNSRDETERITASLRAIARKNHDRDDIFIHHGNISASLRHDAEKALRSSDGHAVVCATSTLELGIDIGRLERVVTLGSPGSVSSFLQRLGRSGRRGNTPEMLVAFSNLSEKDEHDAFDILPFELIQAIAIAEIYRRERFVEPPSRKSLPFGLLCHQTLSVLYSSGVGLSASELARSVLTLLPFRGISVEDYKTILSHLHRKGYISQTDDGKIIIGLSAEPLVSSFRFFAVFKEEISYTVKDENGKEIGEIPELYSPGSRFSLAGRVWACERVDSEARIIYARVTGGKQTSFRHGRSVGTDGKIVSFCKTILLEDEIYPYLGKKAARALTNARELARKYDIFSRPVQKLSDGLWIMLPFLGTKDMNTLIRYLRKYAHDFTVQRPVIENPYVISLYIDDADVPDLISTLKRYAFNDNNLNITLLDEGECYYPEKYDTLVPKELLRKSYARDYMESCEVYNFLKQL